MKHLYFRPGKLAKGIIYLSFFVFISACAIKDKIKPNKLDAYTKVRDIVAQESSSLKKYKEERDKVIDLSSQKKIDLSPVVPDFNPLDKIIIRSLTVDDGDVSMVLKALAVETNTNLLLHPEISKSQDKITVNFSNIRAGLVFKEIMNATDLHGIVQGNLMRIRPYQEKIFSLDFIETNTEATFDMGGDVLGGNVSTNGQESNGLTGQFNIKGKGAVDGNPYDALVKVIDKMKSVNGRYALNRISGSLYIKDKPSVIKNISYMMENLKKMMSRQILIEARILEIQLDDGYQYGIDWALLKNNVVTSLGGDISVANNGDLSLDGGFDSSEISNPAGFSLVFSDGDWLGAVNMLNNFGQIKVVSNPHIRARHAQPSMISVGRSNTYISKTETTNDSDTDTQTATIETDQVFDGLLLGVIPFISDKYISLSIHPIKSDVDDDSLALVSVQNSSVSLPKVDLKEMSTTIKLKDGDTIILGGLIDRRKETTTNGVPGLSSLPILSWLFKSEKYQEVVREFVIVMKVTIV